MVYLLDANVIITAKDSYYAIDQVPEFWPWLVHHGRVGNLKMPRETFDEVSPGTDRDHPFSIWRRDPATKAALQLDEEPDPDLVRQVISQGYAPDLTDDEITVIGADPFLVAYALASPHERIVVTTEASAPSKQRQNRRLPDVCARFSVRCINTFALTRALNFRTNWQKP